VTIELPWSADKAIQQLGRTHRSNQVSPRPSQQTLNPINPKHEFSEIYYKNQRK
jgi:hypothetical protein